MKVGAWGLGVEKHPVHTNESRLRADHPSTRSVLIQDLGVMGKRGQTADDFKNIKLCCISETSSHSLPALKIPTMQWKRLTWQRRRLDNFMLHAVTCRNSLVRFPGI